MPPEDSTKAIAEAKKKDGNEAFIKKDYNEALRLYSEAIVLDPSNHIYRSNRSACYALKGDHAKAKDDAEACVAINPDFIKGYYRLATAQHDMGETGAALSTVNIGLSKDAKNSDLIRLQRIIMAKKSATLSEVQPGGRARAGGSGGTRDPRVDEQTIQEFQELSEAVGGTKRELVEVAAHLQACQRELKRGVLTRDELDSVGAGSRMYQSVGKMFMSQTKEKIDEILDKQSSDRKKSETQLQAKHSYLQKQLTSQQSNLEEIIKNIKAQSSD